MLQWIDIKPAPGGFGEYQVAGIGDTYETITDLLADSDAVEIIDGAELPAGAEDIRGRVHDEPDRLFVVADDGSGYGPTYFGVNEVDDADEPYVRYNIEMLDVRGGRAAAAYAETFGGTVVSTVARYNDAGNDLAIIEIPADQADYMRAEMDGDDNVVEYR